MAKGVLDTKSGIFGYVLHFFNKASKRRPVKYIALAILMFTFVFAAQSLDYTQISEQGSHFEGGINVTGDLNATNLYFGTNLNRGLTSLADVTVSACASGCTYTTIQDAVNAARFIQAHRYRINLNEEDYNENVTIPSMITSRFRVDSEGEIKGYLQIVGNTTDHTKVTVSSISIDASTGAGMVSLTGFTLTGENPNDDEKVSLAVYGNAGYVEVYDLGINCSEIRRGILAYNAIVLLDNITFYEASDGTYNCSDYGVFTKGLGQVYVNDNGLYGSVNGWAVGQLGAGISYVDKSISTLTGADGQYRPVSGMIYDLGDLSLWGLMHLYGGTTQPSTVTVNDTLRVGDDLYVNDDATITDTLTAATLNTGLGKGEFYPMNQAVNDTSAVTFATVDTGLGAGELYPMNQAVNTTSTVTFNNLSLTNGSALRIGSNDEDNYIWFYDAGAWRYIKYDDGSDRFEFDDDIYTTAAITSTGNLNIYGQTIAHSDLMTSGVGDDLWLGTTTQASANYRAYATGDVVSTVTNVTILNVGTTSYLNTTTLVLSGIVAVHSNGTHITIG